jgi:predicted nucleotidyltransferase
MQKVQHFTEKELDILRFFYERKKGHVRLIKKSIKLSEHTLLKYLKSLEQRKVLRSRREGNLKIYEINRESAYLKVFFSYFDLVRLDSLEYKRGKAVKMFVNLLKRNKFPFFVLLFGSTAKDNYTAKSDIDIIVVFDTVDKNISKNVNEVKKRIRAETGLSINIIIMKLSEFLKEKDNKENYALQDAITTGYPVFGNQSYHEVTLQ